MENNENKSFENEEELQTDALNETNEVMEETEESVEEINEFVEEAVEETEELVAASEENGIETNDEFFDNTDKVISKPKNSKGIIAVISAVGVLLVAAIVLLCYNFFIKVPDDGSAVVMSMKGQKMTEADFRYFMVGEAYKVQYAALLEKVQELGDAATDEDINNVIRQFSWDTVDEKTGKTYRETAKENALNAAKLQFVSLNKAAEYGITLSDEEKANIQSYSENLKTQYGDDYQNVLISNGLQSPEQSIKMFENSQLVSNLSTKFKEDPAALGVTDLSILNEYAPDNSATVKHILLMTTDKETGEPVSDEKKAEIRTQAESILERAKNGEDFDALVAEFNEDPGATDAGYTFGPGEMVPEFEAASFALKIGDISDIVETDYGFHIIKRFAGFNEVQNMWLEESNLKVNNRVFNKIVVQKEEENPFKAE